MIGAMCLILFITIFDLRSFHPRIVVCFDATKKKNCQVLNQLHESEEMSPLVSTILKRLFTSATFGYTLILLAMIAFGVLYFVSRYILGSTIGAMFSCCVGGCREQMKGGGLHVTGLEDESDLALRTTFKGIKASLKRHKIITSYNPRFNPNYSKYAAYKFVALHRIGYFAIFQLGFSRFVGETILGFRFFFLNA